jgi:hypothetical protein
MESERRSHTPVTQGPHSFPSISSGVWSPKPHPFTTSGPLYDIPKKSPSAIGKTTIVYTQVMIIRYVCY